jgi:hypothetical protein
MMTQIVGWLVGCLYLLKTLRCYDWRHVGTNRCVDKAIATPVMTNMTIANRAIPIPLIQPV